MNIVNKETKMRAANFPQDSDLYPDGVDEAVTFARNWANAALGHADPTQPGGAFAAQLLPSGPTFSFMLGGQPSAELLVGWQVSRSSRTGDNGITVHQVIWSDPQSGLECELELQTFAAFPAVEWLLRFRNTGSENTALLEDIRPLDAQWAASDMVQLRRSLGSPCTKEDFRYQIEPLAPGATLSMAAGGGRSSNAWLPFFNLQTGNTGVISAIGWSGQWAADYSRETENMIRLRAGQELTRLVLHPGEEIRTPRILLLFWNGEPQAGHNVLRRFILAHHVPKVDGQPVVAPISAATWGGMESVHHLEQIQDIRTHQLAYDYYWIDAGWYGPAGSFSPDVYTYEWAKYGG
ncbi:MAG: hypothetical protein HQL31_12540, partial [Planctomycetes bacterium]|nr:hypothetical protein [Planctomycetota bacterium]